MDEHEILAEAQELIEVRQYHNARRLLNTIADNPTAQQLLADLDQMPPPTPKRIPTKSTPKRPIPPDYNGPLYSDPWNPKTLLPILVMFPVGALPVLSLNWRRLGRPSWALPSLIAGVLLGLWSLACLIILGLIPAFVLGFSLFFAYLVGHWALQVLEYRKYLQVGDVGGIDRYPHDTTWLLGSLGVLIAVLLLTVVGVVIYTSQTEKIDTAYLTVERPFDWDVDETNDNEYCRNYAHGCLLMMTSGETAMAFVYYPRAGSTAEAMASQLWQDYEANNPAIVLGRHQVFKIDKQAVTFQEFTSTTIESGAGDGRYYFHVARGYVSIPGGLIEITFWSSNDGNFRDRQDDFDTILDSIHLKNNTTSPS